jgi:hypothetical protein
VYLAYNEFVIKAAGRRVWWIISGAEIIVFWVFVIWFGDFTDIFYYDIANVDLWFLYLLIFRSRINMENVLFSRWIYHVTNSPK